jgi:3-hydroxyisobutyrate dehydrogenase-like beta-hydroxyacid dehydrogenase
MRIGFLGIGQMGQGMARNLLKAGHEIIVYNRTRQCAEELQSDGARVADTPADASRLEIVFTMLADDAAVENVVFGDWGMLGALPSGGLHVSMSTISTALARRLNQAHAEKGQKYISAPVFGRPEAAAAGRLVIVAAGAASSIDRARPMLEAMGQKIFTGGAEPWMANAIKLAGNFSLAALLETLGEAMALMRKAQIDPKLFLEITNSLYRSPVYENYGKMIAEQKFEPAGFALRLGLKDVRLALAAADEAQMPMPLGDLLRDQFVRGVDRGYGEIDWAGVARVVADDAGLPS